MQKIEVIQVGGVYVVSDGGYIAKALGLGDVPWHLVAPSLTNVPERIQQMEQMLARVPCPEGSISGAFYVDLTETPTKEKKKKKKIVRRKTVKQGVLPANGLASMTIRELVGKKLLGTHVARIEKGLGAKTVGDLCQLTPADLLEVRGVGAKMVKTVEACLKKHNLKLSELVV